VDRRFPVTIKAAANFAIGDKSDSFSCITSKSENLSTDAD